MEKEIERLFNECVEQIEKKYSKSHEVSILIVEELIRSRLDDAFKEINKLSFVEFSKKYLNTYEYFEYKDFTRSEVSQIISETPLTERDRKLACLRYLELRSEEEIASILYIDKKTVHSNLPKISMALKRTAHKLFFK